MTTTIQNCINWFQGQVTTSITDIKYAPQYPTSNIVETFSCMAWADNIQFENSASNAKTFFDLNIDILRKNEPLEDAFKWLEGKAEAVAAIFAADPTMGGYATTYGTVTATIKETAVMGVGLIGYHITISKIKILR